jgi:ADP-ribose pyrophosphatase
MIFILLSVVPYSVLGNHYLPTSRYNGNIVREKKLTSTYLYRGNILNLRKDKVALSGSNTADREVVEHKNAAVILPYSDPHNIYLIKQFRYAINTPLLEAPAGLIDDGESPLEAAKRELKEETGFFANTWTFLGASYPTPGFCTEKLYFYAATDLSKGETNFDEDEFVELAPMTAAHMETLIDQHELIDGKTIQIYLMFKRLFK